MATLLWPGPVFTISHQVSIGINIAIPLIITTGVFVGGMRLLLYSRLN